MSRLTLISVALVTAPLLHAQPVLAQTRLSADDPLVKEAQEQRVRTTTAETGNGLSGRLRPAFRVITSNEDSDVSITASRNSEADGGLKAQSFAVTLTAPLSKTTGRADFITVDGLPGQVSLGFSYSASFTDLDDIKWNNDQIAQLMLKSEQACRNENAGRSFDDDKMAEVCETSVPFRNRKDLHLNTDDKAQLLTWFEDPIKVVKRRSFVTGNFAGSVGTEEFEFFDVATLVSGKQRKTSYLLGASVGFLPHLNSNVFIVGGFELKRSYKAASDSTFCPTGGTGPTVKCTTGPFGPPKEEIDRKIKLTVRYAGALKFGPAGSKESTPFGIEFISAYDFHDKTWGIEVPFYVLVDKDHGLTGGLRGAYDSKEDDFQFGVFVSKAFGFLNI